MADWFETRFRAPVDAGQLDPAFVARIRALAVEEWRAEAGTPSRWRADAVTTSPDFTQAADREGDLIMLETEARTTVREPTPPRRPSPGRWLLVVAAAAVVAVVGTLLIAAGGDDEDPVDTATPTPTTTPAQDVMAVPGASEGFPLLEPGRYYVDPDGDDTPLRVSYEIPTAGWSAWFGAVKFAGSGSTASGSTALSITTVPNLVSDGCLDHTPLAPPVGPTVDDLATALSMLAPFEVTAPPTDVTLLGYQGKHLGLTVPDLQVAGRGESQFVGCLAGELHSWISPLNGGSFSGYDGPGQTEEFWILDVDGTRLVLVKLDSPAAPVEDVVERDAIFDSIRIER